MSNTSNYLIFDFVQFLDSSTKEELKQIEKILKEYSQNCVVKISKRPIFKSLLPVVRKQLKQGEANLKVW